MATTKTIVVVGATGNQGSSVAHTFLGLPNWQVRCITRNPSSAAAQELAALGADVVQADLSDINSLRTPFSGVHAIFLNTDFWGPYVASPDGQKRPPDSDKAFNIEVDHGRNAAIVAAAVPTLERFVYSALGPMKKHSKGKYTHSYHWDSKATIVEYIQTEQPELAKKTSYIYIGAFTSNPLVKPRKLDSNTGRYQFIIPMKKEQIMPIINPRESTGPFVQALIETEDPGVKLLAYDSLPTLGEIVDLWSKASGKPADYVEVTAEHMNREFGIPMEVLDATGYLPEFGYMGGVDGFIEPDQLKVRPRTKPFVEWLNEQDWENIL